MTKYNYFNFYFKLEIIVILSSFQSWLLSDDVFLEKIYYKKNLSKSLYVIRDLNITIN